MSSGRAAGLLIATGVCLSCVAGCGSSAGRPGPTISVGRASSAAPTAAPAPSSPQCRMLPPVTTIERISGYRDLQPQEYYDTGQRSCTLMSANGRHSVTFQFFAGDGRRIVLQDHAGRPSRTLRAAVVTTTGRVIVYRRGHTYSVDLGDDADPRTAQQLALLRA